MATKRRYNPRARVGKLTKGQLTTIVLVSTAVVVVGAVALGYKDLDKKIVLYEVTDFRVSGGRVLFNMVFANLSSNDVGLDGFSGQLKANWNDDTWSDGIDLATILVTEPQIIPAHGQIAVPVSVSPNWLGLIPLGIDFREIIVNKDWGNVKLGVIGDVFSGAITLNQKVKFVG